MWPEVLIGAGVMARVSAELERVAPAEGVAVPLVALTRRDEGQSPCALYGLRQIHEVIIAHAVLVPRAQQVNALARVSVLPRTDEQVNAEVLASIRRHPALRACGHLHSHPFARGCTRPSRGAAGDYEGHMLPLRLRNRECNLDTSFSFIACRAGAGRRGAAGWVLQGFALDRRGEIVDLGLARVIADQDPRMRRCLLGPLQTRTPQRQLLRRFARGLRRARLAGRVDDLFDGWWRAAIRVAGGRCVVLLVPVGFPDEPAQLYVVRRDRLTGAVASRRLGARLPTDPASWPWLARSLGAEEETGSHDIA